MRPALLALLATLALAAPAGAATVQTSSLGSGLMTIEAEPGEANDLTVTHRAGDPQLVIHDERAPLRLLGDGSASCYATGEHTVECFFTPPEIVVRTLDGDDRVALSGEPILRPLVQLGAGDDVGSAASGEVDGDDGDDDITGPSLYGGQGADRLTMLPGPGFLQPGDGGPGDDVVLGSGGAEALSGGPGADDVRGGGGDDLLSDGDGEPGADDRYDGGEGRDELAYYSRRAGVRVDLGAGTGGATDRDRIAGVEIVSGGEGADELVGTDGADELRGSPGADAIDGRGGDDVLDGGAGDDRLLGGAGRDTVRGWGGRDLVDGAADDDPILDGGPDDDAVFGGTGADHLTGGLAIDTLDGGDGDDTLATDGDWRRDRLTCGAGADGATIDRGDLADGTCEQVATKPPGSLLGFVAQRGARRVLEVGSDGTAFVTPTCLPLLCAGTVELWVAGRRVARAPFTCGQQYDGECLRFDAYARLRIPRRLRRQLRRAGRVSAMVAVVLDPGVRQGVLPATERALLVRRR